MVKKGHKQSPEHIRNRVASVLAKGRGKSPTKRCPSCEKTKPRSDFGVRTNGYSKSHCRVCEADMQRVRPKDQETVREMNWRTNLKRYFGITPKQYDDMVEAQGNLCAICGREETATKSGKVRRLNVDHCHKTMVIRGLLCNGCNHTLGLMGDDPERLRRAADYLEQDFSAALVAVPGLPSGVPRSKITSAA